jgi:hypothetical protein
MTIEQYSAFIAVMPQLESLLVEKGQFVPRPKYDGAAEAPDGSEDDEEEESKKANIEATSDEEE